MIRLDNIHVDGLNEMGPSRIVREGPFSRDLGQRLSD